MTQTEGGLTSWLWSSRSIPAALVDSDVIVIRSNEALTAAAAREMTGQRLMDVVVDEHRARLSDAVDVADGRTMTLACFADDRGIATDHVVSVIPDDRGNLIILEPAHHEVARLARSLMDAQLELAHAQRELGRQKKDLELALAELRATKLYIRKVEGILPICSECRRVRDDADDWVELPIYLMRHDHVSLSHGYCPDCYERAAAGI